MGPKYCLTTSVLSARVPLLGAIFFLGGAIKQLKHDGGYFRDEPTVLVRPFVVVRIPVWSKTVGIDANVLRNSGVCDRPRTGKQ